MNTQVFRVGRVARRGRAAFVLAAAALSLACSTAQVPSLAAPPVARVPSAVDIGGSWTGDFHCPPGIARRQRVQIQRHDRLLVATKLIGDACVPAGFVVWQGQLPADVIRVADLPLSVGLAVTVGAAGGPSGRIPGRLTIHSADRLSVLGGDTVELVRDAGPSPSRRAPSTRLAIAAVEPRRLPDNKCD